MNSENQQNPMSLSFQLFYSQIRKAHEIYEMHCFTYDFGKRCHERREDGIGLCNLPYEILFGEGQLMNTAYKIYCKKQDSNVSYNDTLDMVVDEIEHMIANGSLPIQPIQTTPNVAIVIEGGVISAAFSSNPNTHIKITELNESYSTSEQRDAAYKGLRQILALKGYKYALSITDYEKEDEE